MPTGLEQLTPAIQEAFNTYWRRKRWMEERQELERGRQQERDVLGMRLKAGAEEARLGREFQKEERLAGEKFQATQAEIERDYQRKRDILQRQFEIDLQATKDKQARLRLVTEHSYQMQELEVEYQNALKLKKIPSTSIVHQYHHGSEEESKWGQLAMEIDEQTEGILEQMRGYKNANDFLEAHGQYAFDSLSSDQFKYLLNHPGEARRYIKWQLAEYYTQKLEGADKESAGGFLRNSGYFDPINWDLQASTDTAGKDEKDNAILQWFLEATPGGPEPGQKLEDIIYEKAGPKLKKFMDWMKKVTPGGEKEPNMPQYLERPMD